MTSTVHHQLVYRRVIVVARLRHVMRRAVVGQLRATPKTMLASAS
tara:strand:+ start:632 stop:766 length:135 start_codon:yes stop_codon:yes gene_type:complete